MVETTNLQSRRRSVGAFYFQAGVREFIPIYPLYAILMGENGITPVELATLFSIWSLVGFVAEVPSGALADTLSRKWLVVASAVLKSLAFLTWYLEPSFWGYAAGFALWGIGSSLRSGAWEALLHDLLAEWHATGDFAKIFGRTNALATLGVGAGELAGGLMIIMGYDFVLLISTVIPLVAVAPFALWVNDPPKDEQAYEADYFDNLKAGIAEAGANRTVLYILLTYSTLIVTYGVYEEFVSPLFLEKGFSLMWVGILGAFISAMEAAGMALADRARYIPLTKLLLMMAVASLVLAATFPLGGWIVPLMIGGYFTVFSMSSTMFGAELQGATQGPARATVTSVAGFGENIGAVLGFMAFGVVAEYFGMNGGTLATGVVAALLALGFIALGNAWGITRGSESD